MLSFLHHGCRWSHRLGAILLAGLIGVAPAWGQTTPALDPAPPPQVVLHGTGSAFDLADLGPHFAESWLVALVPALDAANETPMLMRRVTTPEGMGPAQETRTTYDRAADGRLLERLVERRQGETWTPALRTRYVYQEKALAAQHTAVWLDGTWQPDRQVTLARNTEGEVQEVRTKTRRNGQWVQEARITPVPAETDTSQRHQIIQETWSDGAWTPTTRVTFTIAEEGRHITQHNEVWTRDERWENGVQLTFLYDGAGYPIEKSLSVWAGTEWAEGPLHLYDYYVHGQRVEQRTETWIGTRRIRTKRARLTYAAPVQSPLLGNASFDD